MLDLLNQTHDAPADPIRGEVLEELRTCQRISKGHTILLTLIISPFDCLSGYMGGLIVKEGLSQR